MQKIYLKLVGFLPRWLARFAPGWTLVNFGLSSVGCMLIDLSVFSAVCVPLETGLGRKAAIAIAVPIARIVSGNCNFLYNMKFVFNSVFSMKAYLQYWSLVLVNMTLLMLSTQIVSSWLDAHGLWISLVNFCCEVALFAFSFLMQKFFVFRHK